VDGPSLVCHLLRLGREHGLEPRPRAARRAREQRVLRLHRNARRRTPRRARAVLAALAISAARQVRRELRGLRESARVSKQGGEEGPAALDERRTLRMTAKFLLACLLT